LKQSAKKEHSLHWKIGEESREQQKMIMESLGVAREVNSSSARSNGAKLAGKKSETTWEDNLTSI